MDLFETTKIKLEIYKYRFEVIDEDQCNLESMQMFLTLCGKVVCFSKNCNMIAVFNCFLIFLQR